MTNNAIYALHSTTSTMTNTPALSPSYLGYLDNLIQSSDVIILDADTIQKGAAFDAFIRTIIPFLKKHNRQITFPQAGVLELKHLASSLDAKTAERAKKGQEAVNALFQAGILVFRGNPNERETAGAAIIRYTATNIWDANILVLSQDANVAADCKLFEKIKSAKVNHTVTVKRISDQGRIQNFLDTQDISTKPSNTEQRSAASATSVVLKNRFGI